jgi:aminoglycoside 6'-N-acetyltransferase
MPSERRPRCSFRPVTEEDLPMLAGWLAEPHVAAWRDDPEVELASIREHSTDTCC